MIVESFTSLKKLTFEGYIPENDQEHTWIHELWARLLTKYSDCQLTVASDKLVAISGLARRFCNQLELDPADYLAGLWRSGMPCALLWSIRGGIRVHGRAPSWSWASMDGYTSPFWMGQSSSENFLTHATFIDARLQGQGSDFSPVISGSISIQAPLCHLKIIDENNTGSVEEGIPYFGKVLGKRNPPTFCTHLSTGMRFHYQKCKMNF